MEEVTINITEAPEVVTINIVEATAENGGLPVTTAENDVIVGSSTVGTWVKKTLAQFKTILGLGTAAYTDSTAYLPSNTTIPDQLSDLQDDSTHRTVTDTEKSTWNEKQDALGFTPENVLNKKITLTDSDTDYPTTRAVNTGLSTREVPLTFSNGLTRTLNEVKNNLITGLAGGQTIIGSTLASENLTLSSTSHATKGKILFGNSTYDEANNRLGIRTVAPSYPLVVVDGSTTFFIGIRGAAGIGTTSNTDLNLFTTGTSRIRIQADGTYIQLKTPTIIGGSITPSAWLNLPAGTATASTAPLKFTSGTLNTTAEIGAIEFLTDNLYLTITTGVARKGFVLDNGTALTSGKIPIASTNGRLIDGQTPLAGTKVYYVADSLSGDTTRKLTFIDGILTSET